MSGATTRQPVPDSMQASRAKGYLREADQWSEQGFMYIPLAPAGSASATALDMARLMVELLNPRSTSILNAASKSQLLGGAYLNHPMVNGMTLGMYERTQGAMRAVGHDGGTMLFSSAMVLWPEARMGLFVSTNTLGAQTVVRDLVATVSTQLGFSGRQDRLAPVANGDLYVGEYLGARRNFSNFTKVMGLLDAVQVSFDSGEQVLWVTNNEGTRQYRQLDEHVFKQVSGHQRITFKVDAGRAQELFFSNVPVIGYERVAGADSPRGNLVLLGVWLLLALGVVVVWPLATLAHRQDEVVRGQRLLSLVVYVSVVVVVLFFVQVGTAAGSPYQLVTTGMNQIPPLLWYPAVFMLLTVWQLVSLYRVWADGFWWLSRRLYFSVFVIAQCALAGWFWHWNLVPEF